MWNQSDRQGSYRKPVGKCLRFYKANDSQELPKYFTIATEVGGGMAAAGLHSRTPEVTAHSGRSFLDTILRDQKVPLGDPKSEALK